MIRRIVVLMLISISIYISATGSGGCVRVDGNGASNNDPQIQANAGRTGVEIN